MQLLVEFPFMKQIQKITKHLSHNVSKDRAVPTWCQNWGSSLDFLREHWIPLQIDGCLDSFEILARKIRAIPPQKFGLVWILHQVWIQQSELLNNRVGLMQPFGWVMWMIFFINVIQDAQMLQIIAIFQEILIQVILNRQHWNYNQFSVLYNWSYSLDNIGTKRVFCIQYFWTIWKCSGLNCVHFRCFHDQFSPFQMPLCILIQCGSRRFSSVACMWGETLLSQAVLTIRTTLHSNRHPNPK